MSILVKAKGFYLPVLVVIAALTVLATPTLAVVVDAGGGPTDPLYANWGPNANFANPAPNSYDNYRRSTDNLTTTAVATDNGDGTATWDGIEHGPNRDSPGMFFGRTASTSSYADARLLIGAYNDDAGGRGSNGGMADDNSGRFTWDIRIGFTEDPAAWVAGRPANDDQFDLWTGDHQSDTVYMHPYLFATDSPDVDPNDSVENTNQHVYIERTLAGQPGDSALTSELDRNSWFLGGSFGIWEPLEVNGVVPTAADEYRNEAGSLDTGIGYDDEVPVEWSMELNLPGGGGTDLENRQVKFTATLGDIVYTQVFDPGSPTVDSIPNHVSASTATWEDGYFDWQNAFPVFFLAPTSRFNAGGQATTSGEGIIGFDTGPGDPSDVDGDGDVDGDDFLQLQRTGGDIAAWQAAYPNPIGGLSGVPEPSTGLLLLTALGFGGLRYRWRCR